MLPVSCSIITRLYWNLQRQIPSGKATMDHESWGMHACNLLLCHVLPWHRCQPRWTSTTCLLRICCWMQKAQNPRLFCTLLKSIWQTCLLGNHWLRHYWGNRGQVFAVPLSCYFFIVDGCTWVVSSEGSRDLFPFLFWIFSSRKHMLPARGAAYPTLAQKHLNGAVGTSRVMENQIWTIHTWLMLPRKRLWWQDGCKAFA